MQQKKLRNNEATQNYNIVSQVVKTHMLKTQSFLIHENNQIPNKIFGFDFATKYYFFSQDSVSTFLFTTNTQLL